MLVAAILFSSSFCGGWRGVSLEIVLLPMISYMERVCILRSTRSSGFWFRGVWPKRCVFPLNVFSKSEVWGRVRRGPKELKNREPSKILDFLGSSNPSSLRNHSFFIGFVKIDDRKGNCLCLVGCRSWRTFHKITEVQETLRCLFNNLMIF